MDVVYMLSHFSHVQLFVTLWTEALQDLLSMRFSRQEYWSELHALLQGIFLTQGLNPCLRGLLHLQVASLPTEPPGKSINGHLILNLKHDERGCVILGCACKNCLEEYHICQAGEIWLSMEMFGKENLALSYIVCYVI